jgi:hypothetical protein
MRGMVKHPGSHSAIALFIMRRISGSVSACEKHPGMDGTSAQYPPIFDL